MAAGAGEALGARSVTCSDLPAQESTLDAVGGVWGVRGSRETGQRLLLCQVEMELAWSRGWREAMGPWDIEMVRTAGAGSVRGGTLGLLAQALSVLLSYL